MCYGHHRIYVFFLIACSFMSFIILLLRGYSGSSSEYSDSFQELYTQCVECCAYFSSDVKKIFCQNYHIPHFIFLRYSFAIIFHTSFSHILPSWLHTDIIFAIYCCNLISLKCNFRLKFVNNVFLRIDRLKLIIINCVTT